MFTDKAEIARAAHWLVFGGLDGPGPIESPGARLFFAVSVFAMLAASFFIVTGVATLFGYKPKPRPGPGDPFDDQNIPGDW